MTQEEKELSERLKILLKDKTWIELSLAPDKFHTITPNALNKCRINEGRLGTFRNISEGFYDEMVNLFDSRYR